MKWGKFIVLIQAVLVLVFMVSFFLQATLSYNSTSNSSLEKGFAFPFSDPAVMNRFSVAAGILLVILILELIILTCFW